MMPSTDRRFAPNLNSWRVSNWSGRVGWAQISSCAILWLRIFELPGASLFCPFTLHSSPFTVSPYLFLRRLACHDCLSFYSHTYSRYRVTLVFLSSKLVQQQIASIFYTSTMAFALLTKCTLTALAPFAIAYAWPKQAHGLRKLGYDFSFLHGR